MQNAMRSTYTDGFTVNTTTQTKMKQILILHLPLNMTNSNSYYFYSTHDFHKFISAQTIF